MNTEYLVKLILIGAEKTSKSYLLTKFMNGENKQIYEPAIGVEFCSKMIQFQLRGKTIKTEIQIWDTAGAERFQNIINAYYRSSSAVFIVFDVNNIESFSKCKFYIENVYKNCSEDVKKQTMLVAIQLSDERKVTSDEAFLFAMQYDIFYTEVNKDTNVEQILHRIVNSYVYQKNANLQLISMFRFVIRMQ
ncbi:Rab11 [Hexamita inflata]|uniref:Rab11 n=1 Tax=Hexamita inflata TaxID=28002 RepID=A0AA86UZX5_9EUKA|nr:Rab11 [Hexamita inflata]